MSESKGSAVFITILLLIGAYFLFKEKEIWTGYFYPTAENLDIFRTSPQFKTLEECRDWAQSQTGYPNQTWDYECGLNCEFKAEYGLNVCKETVQ